MNFWKKLGEIKRGKMKTKDMFVLLAVSLLIVLSLAAVYAIPYFTTSGTTSNAREDVVFTYNFSANVSESGSPNPDTPWVFSIYQINSSLYPSQQTPSFYTWINMNSSSGILTINATNDSMSGRFNMSIDVTGGSGQGEKRNFFFIVNASNDVPNITHINNTYNLTVNTTFIAYVNGSDEEGHWPLVFNLSFFSNCTKVPYNNRTDCNLFNFVNVSSNSSIINYTPSRYEAGIYWANLSVIDFGSNYNCVSGYCLANYSQNATFLYSRIIQFNVYHYLYINTTHCQNKIFQENVSGSCWINITTREYGDNVSYTSNASLRNYAGYITNSTWFSNSRSNYSNNYTLSILINVTPQKGAIGNWTINFSAADINFSENSFDLIYVYVNRTTNDIPRIRSISNLNSTNAAYTRINVTVFDDDHLIPDRSVYNESINFTITVVNQTDTSQVINLSPYNFVVNVTSNPVLGTNRTEGKIEFTPNITMVGNYIINITARDRENANVTITFNMSIWDNLFPLWNTTLTRSFSIFEGNNTFLNLSQNASDPNPGDIISFQYSADSFFPSFNMNTTTGIINFTTNDSDVGFHIVTINVTDGFLINSTTFNFSIINVNESPSIIRPISLVTAGPGGGGNSDSGMIAVENYQAVINMYVEDGDSGIPIEQKAAYYNESLYIRNLSISGRNPNLFSFSTITQPSNLTNRTTFQTSFIPQKTDVGSYTITINVSDRTNRSDTISFSLDINSSKNSPNLSILYNQSSAVNRTFSYPINVSDLEDGDSTQAGNLNFTFSYSFLNGTDFINNNQSIFNKTTGKLNITFNSSQAGAYRLNITVNDTDGYNDTDSFWIYVYDAPVIVSPSAAIQYLNLSESNSYVLNFSINQSVQDNVTCEFYLDTPKSGRLLRYNISYYGNGTILAWNLSANYSDESFGVGNITLITYPSSSALANATSLNSTRSWNISINHTNAPLQFLGNIGGAEGIITGGSPQQIYLSDYFYDWDAADVYHNQTITFNYTLVSSSGAAMSVSYSNWTNGTRPLMTFSATSNANATFSVVAYEWNESNSSQILSNSTSNNFTIRLNFTTETTTVTVTTPASGGGSSSVTTEVPYSLKIIVPSKISGYTNQKIIVPLRLSNNGKETFKNISLSALGFKNSKLESGLKISFEKQNVASLAPGASQNITMTLLFEGDKSGDYEITVNATSKSPSYMDWSKIYINLQRINESEVKKYLLFVEEYIVQNPSCLELKERLKEADKSIEKVDYATARAIAEGVLDSCKEHIKQVSIPKRGFLFREYRLSYFVIAIFISIIAGIFYYYFKRRSYNRSPIKLQKPFQKENTNKGGQLDIGV